MRPIGYGTTASKPATNSSQYFEGNRKGEVNELRVLLKGILNDKDDKKKREVVKKVIAYMTLGIDVSKLFSEMCMASYTNDLIQKKMIYLYLTTYAESHSELAIMAINTFQKDCKHQDSKIRGLALRNLCFLRFSGAYEYMLPCIRDGLLDLDAYVRKTAIMGCVKLFYTQPESIKESDIVDQLYKMIKDNDTLVIINAIQALNEILASEGGMAISGKMIVYLLNRIKEFNEWGQTVILDLLSKFKPKSEQELFDIMNLLEDRLKHSCAAIVLGTLKVFMNFTKDAPKIYQQVVERSRSPLITLASSSEISGSYEVTYAVLSHIYYITSKGYSEVFEKDYKIFYCKTDEPTYNKFLKLQILASVASDQNLGDMLNELGEYVTDVDTELSRRSIAALGSIAIRLPLMTSAIVKQLCSFVALQKEYITNEVIVVFKDILRKQPKQITEIIEVVNQSIECITDPGSKVALIYILGEHGSEVPLAPYLLENFVTTFRSEQLEVKHQLLNSSVKLFLKRAPEMHQMLAKVFTLVLDEQEDIDLRDRASYFYRALQSNVQEVKTAMLSPQAQIDKFMEEQQSKNDELQVEFNTLAVIFQKPESKFIKTFEHFNAIKSKELQEETALAKQREAEARVEQSTPTTTAPPVQQAVAQPADVSNLLDVADEPQRPLPNNNVSAALPDLLDIKFSVQQPTNVGINGFVPNFKMDEEAFEQGWTNYEGASIKRQIYNMQLVNEQYLEQLFLQNNLQNIACGEEDNVIKMYFYGKMQNGLVAYIELEADKSERAIQISTKCEDEDVTPYVTKFIEDFLRSTVIQ